MRAITSHFSLLCICSLYILFVLCSIYNNILSRLLLMFFRLLFSIIHTRQPSLTLFCFPFCLIMVRLRDIVTRFAHPSRNMNWFVCPSSRCIYTLVPSGAHIGSCNQRTEIQGKAAPLKQHLESQTFRNTTQPTVGVQCCSQTWCQVA